MSARRQRAAKLSETLHTYGSTIDDLARERDECFRFVAELARQFDALPLADDARAGLMNSDDHLRTRHRLYSEPLWFNGLKIGDLANAKVLFLKIQPPPKSPIIPPPPVQVD
jgi:hypothetical protein